MPEPLRERYVNFFTDFGFKRLFGSEPTKACLVDFLNSLLTDRPSPIRQLQFRRSEHLGAAPMDRRAIFDLYCESASGERFIVELQKAKQKFFKDRSLFYATFPIQEQAAKGNWDFQLDAVYTIGILDFVFDEDVSEPDKYLYNVKLAEMQSHRVFHDKLSFVYVEMPKFRKTLGELRTHQDKWLYALRHLSELADVPDGFRENVFERFFAAAEIARLEPPERDAYEESLKYYRDMKNVIDTAVEEGRDLLAREFEQRLEKERRRRDAAEREKESALREREAERREKESALRERELLLQRLVAMGMSRREIDAILRADAGGGGEDDA